MAKLNGVCSGEEKVSGSVRGRFLSFFFLEMQESEREPKGGGVTQNCTRSSTWAHPACTHTNASSGHLPAPPQHTYTQHFTRVSAALRHSPLSSLLFHQNIADEVLSSINHCAAPLHSPPINQQLCRTAGPDLLVLPPDVLTPQTHLPTNTSRTALPWSLIHFGMD